MAKLKYFKDGDVPCFITQGIKNVLSKEVVFRLIELAYERSEKHEETAYFQVYDIEGRNNTVKVKLSQEQPDIITEHEVKLKFSKCKFKGRVYLIESWNGATENVTVNDHYITMLLPSEY